MTKVLYLLPFPPRLDADHGGSRVIANLILRIAEKDPVAVIYLRTPGEPPLDPALRSRCEIAAEVARPPARSIIGALRRSVRLAGSAMLLRQPMWAADWRVPAFAAKAREVAEVWRPDVVQADYHVMGQYWHALDRCSAARVLVEHEPGVQAARDRRRNERGLRGLLYGFDTMAWQRYEPRVLRGADAVVVFTGRDHQAIKPLANGTRIEHLPFGATAGFARPGTGDDCSHQVLFAGNYLHPPNVDAALRLAGRIFPAVRQRIPDAMLRIAGSHPPPALRRKADNAVRVIGYVPDLDALMAHTGVFAVPLRFGGGMRVKVVDALAAGKPLVASALAVEGLDVQPGEHFVHAESDGEFSGAIVELLSDPAACAAMGDRARRWAEANLGWEKAAAGYLSLYESLRPR